MNNLTKLKFKHGETEFEIESDDKEFVSNQFKKFLEQYESIKENYEIEEKKDIEIETPSEISKSTDKQLTIKEFHEKSNVSKGTDGAIIAAYYIEKIQGKCPFTRKELNNKLKELKIGGNNPSATVFKILESGYLSKKGQDSVELTRKGEKWVKEKLEE